MSVNLTSSTYFPNVASFVDSNLTDDDFKPIDQIFSRTNPSKDENTLDFGSNGIELKQLPNFFSNLSKYKVVALSFEKNLIGPEGIKTIAEFLKKDNSLKGLNLSANPLIGPKEGVELFKSLEKNKTLKALHLRYTTIDDTALKALKNMLSTKTIEELDLSKTDITDEAKKELNKIVAKRMKSDHPLNIIWDLNVPNDETASPTFDAKKIKKEEKSLSLPRKAQSAPQYKMISKPPLIKDDSFLNAKSEASEGDDDI